MKKKDAKIAHIYEGKVSFFIISILMFESIQVRKSLLHQYVHIVFVVALLFL